MKQGVNWKDPEAVRQYHRQYRLARKADDTATFDASYAMTHEEIGKALGLTRARVWQLERSAMKKLREAFAEPVMVEGRLVPGITKLSDILPIKRRSYSVAWAVRRTHWVEPSMIREGVKFRKKLNFGKQEAA